MAFHKSWVFGVVSGGGITKDDVFLWLQQARIPLWFEFIYDANTKWNVDCSPEYGCWPLPEQDWTFIVVRPSSIINGLHMKNAAGLGWEKKFCITAGFGEDPETLGLRIWHEALHAMGSDSDMLNPGVTPNDVESFRNFVETNDTFRNDANVASFLNLPHNHPNNSVLRAYYYYLMVNRLGCPALPIPSGPVATISLWQRLIIWLKSIFK